MVHVDNSSFRAIKSATPGPYTFILPGTPEVPRRLLHPKKKTVGVRIPDHVVVQAILEELGEPILTSTLIMPGETEARTSGGTSRRRSITSSTWSWRPASTHPPSRPP